jgi:antirestriction protein
MTKPFNHIMMLYGIYANQQIAYMQTSWQEDHVTRMYATSQLYYRLGMLKHRQSFAAACPKVLGLICTCTSCTTADDWQSVASWCKQQ